MVRISFSFKACWWSVCLRGDVVDESVLHDEVFDEDSVNFSLRNVLGGDRLIKSISASKNNIRVMLWPENKPTRL